MYLKLLKNEEQKELAKQEDELIASIATLVQKGCSTVSEIASALGLTFAKASILLNDPRVTLVLRQQTTAGAKLLLHSKALPVLNNLITTGDSKEKLAAIKLTAELAGESKASLQININTPSSADVPLEQKIKQVRNNLDEETQELNGSSLDIHSKNDLSNLIEMGNLEYRINTENNKNKENNKNES